MLKTNSKKAKENARAVLIDLLEYSYSNEGQELFTSSMLERMADQLIDSTTDAAGRLYTAWYKTIQDGFSAAIVADAWPYTEQARETLVGILEETEEEASKYNTAQIYSTLSAMLYREFEKMLDENGLKAIPSRYVWRRY